jgi:hypothetical protein
VFGHCYPAPMSDRDSAIEEPRQAGRLTRWQRAWLVASAVAFGGLGVLAIFTTENEAGTAVALLLCGVLLLVAIQGMMVQRITAGDKSIELAYVRRNIAEQAKSEAHDDPDGARELIEAYQAADPGSRGDPLIASAKASIYESQVLAAVMIAMPEIAPGAQVAGGDDVLYQVDGNGLVVEAKYRLPHRRLYPNDIRKLLSRLAARPSTAMLIVSNVGVTREAQRLLEESQHLIKLVEWNPDDGPEPVRTALAELLDSMGPR